VLYNATILIMKGKKIFKIKSISHLQLSSFGDSIDPKFIKIWG
jgi:hypothetical protein